MSLRKTWREDLIRNIRAKLGWPQTDFPFFIKGRQDVIFVHIPKTAGTSMRHSFGLNRPRGYLGDPRFVKHLTAREIKEVIGEEVFQRAFSIAFVRNPWDRFYSWYRFLYRKNRNGMADRELSFPAFVEDCFSPGEYKYGGSKAFLKSQFYWISDDQGNVIVDFVGRFERINEDYQKVIKKIGVSALLGERNRGTPVDYRQAYTPELRAIIADRYKEDIEFFGYTFDS